MPSPLLGAVTVCFRRAEAVLPCEQAGVGAIPAAPVGEAGVLSAGRAVLMGCVCLACASGRVQAQALHDYHDQPQASWESESPPAPVSRPRGLKSWQGPRSPRGCRLGCHRRT